MKSKFAKSVSAAILAMALMGQVSAFAAASGFKDVPSSHWAYNTIMWGQQNKVVEGFQDGTFRPSQGVSESQFLAMLLRSYKTDIPVAQAGENWSTPYYTLAKSLNYPVTGNVNAVITRTSVAELVAATQGKNYSGTNAIKYMLAKGLAQGKTGNSVDGYQGNDTLTRAEAVQFIKNVLDKLDTTELLPRPSTPSDPSELEGIQDGSNTVVDRELEKIGKGEDQQLAGLATKVNNALKGTGFNVFYNVEQGALGVDDPKTNRIMFLYFKEPMYDGTIIQYANLVDSGAKEMRSDYVNAMVKAMNSLGLSVGETFKKTLDDADWDGKTRTIKIGNTQYNINPTHAGDGFIAVIQ
ncbi:S-layer homology domain-containing protein [Paenibacillus barengoltzii]|uniref:S-layer homology domain-containing protein n=1 Tax=Paenibacillus barengoltzii TaxID=343517 RepID=UPI003F8CE3D9